MLKAFSRLKLKQFIPHSLKIKLILSVLLLLLLFITIFMINNIVLNSIIIKNIDQSVINNVKQANLSLTYVLEHAKEQAYQLSAQVTEREDIEGLLSHGNPSMSKYEEFDTTMHYISELTKIGLTNKLDSIYVFSTLRGKLITSNNGVFEYDEISDYIWMEQALSISGNDALKWLGNCYYLNKQQWSSQAYIISLICRAHIVNRNILSDVYFGLNFNESEIYNIFKDVKITPNSIVYLTDQNGIVISAKEKAAIGTDWKKIVSTGTPSGYNDIGRTGRIKIDGEYFQRITINNEITNWDIVALIPEKELFADRWIFWLFVVLSMSIVSVCTIFIAYRTIVRYVDRPVKKLVKAMKVVEKGDFNINISEKRIDEFGALFTGFNEMVGKIDILIRELYQEKLLKRDMELKYLQKLINPHFLYNTLDTIRWLAKENRLSDVSTLTLALSSMYRTIFNRGQDFITLCNSISNIENYLMIQKVRYGGAFSYKIHVDEEVNNYLILNLILQPAVENALIHGIQKREVEGGKVRITARLKDNLICVRVFDNGAGMRRDKLKIVKAYMKSSGKMNDSGLKIVYQKIKLFYGDKYGIRIRSSYRRGTCISFIFPVFEYLNNPQPLP